MIYKASPIPQIIRFPNYSHLLSIISIHKRLFLIILAIKLQVHSNKTYYFRIKSSLKRLIVYFHAYFDFLKSKPPTVVTVHRLPCVCKINMPKLLLNDSLIKSSLIYFLLFDYISLLKNLDRGRTLPPNYCYASLKIH